jgi:hypothetical protein
VLIGRCALNLAPSPRDASDVSETSQATALGSQKHPQLPSGSRARFCVSPDRLGIAGAKKTLYVCTLVKRLRDKNGPVWVGMGLLASPTPVLSRVVAEPIPVQLSAASMG